jgi:predicted DNA binding CopG/RHH family protein
MKYYELTGEEKKTLAGIEAGKYPRVKNYHTAKKSAVTAAKNTLNKTKNINIRLSEKVLMKLRAKAAKEGVPYQTLAASILHKSVAGC